LNVSSSSLSSARSSPEFAAVKARPAEPYTVGVAFKVDLLFPLSSSHFALHFSSNRDPSRAPSLVLPRAASPPPHTAVRCSATTARTRVCKRGRRIEIRWARSDPPPVNTGQIEPFTAGFARKHLGFLDSHVYPSTC
jgi:hypothetical protein